jgi:hypothetical protein
MCWFRKKKNAQIPMSSLATRKVENKNRKFGESAEYIYVPMAEQAGTEMVVTPLLFTQREINEAKLRASRNMEDLVG